MASLSLHLPPTTFKVFPVRATASSSNGRASFSSGGASFSKASNGLASSANGVAFYNPKSGGPIILDIPLDKIRRPLTRTRSNDPEKVKELMESIQEIGLQVPIDVLEVDGVYYGFSGCHRFEAHQRLGLPTIRCKIRRGTKETLRHHLR